LRLIAILNVLGGVNQPVDFDQDNWADDCDFDGNNLKAGKLTAGRKKCEQNCRSNPLCTHYAFSNYTSGHCFQKQGIICPSDAKVKPVGKYKTSCGFIPEKLNLN